MNFTVNTKPLIEALNLGVINSNVSPFHKKSTIIQVSADEHDLKLNVEAESIKSELTLKGSGDSKSIEKIFVSSLLMKQLVSTFDSTTVTLEFAEGGLILHSGTSKFTLPKLIDEDDIELDRPAKPMQDSLQFEIDKASWKFIQDRQMYSKSMSFIHPVYTYVWVGESGDVLVGDFDNSLFTHSKKNTLQTTCLLSDTIINLFESLPDNTKLSKYDKDYILQYDSDSLTYVSQFSPKYENENDIGDYNSDIFLDMMEPPETSYTFDTSIINKYLSQAELLSTSTDDTIKFIVKDKVLELKDNNVHCKLGLDGDSTISEFDIEFKTDMIKKVLSNYPDKVVNISAVEQDGEVAGMLVWDEDVVTIVAGVD